MIPVATEGSKLFHEYNFMPHMWTIESTGGFSTTLPYFFFYFEKVDYEERHPASEDIMRFIRDVMDKMQLTTECIVISLIYLELVMLTGKIEIRDNNWKPLVFTSILLASKFWEDIIWYNADFVENLEMYSLKSINRMESEFLSLCDYNIYVSAEKYEDYQEQVRAISIPEPRHRDNATQRTLSNPLMASSNHGGRKGGLLQKLMSFTTSQPNSGYNNLGLETITQPLLYEEKQNPFLKID